MFMCYFQFQWNHEDTEEKSQVKKWNSTVHVDNSSQAVPLDSWDAGSSLEFLHLQSVGKRKDQVIESLRTDRLGYMKPYLKN